MIVDALLTALAVFILIKLWKKIHRPQVWIIDDSPVDIMLYKARFKLDAFDVRYFTSAEYMAHKMIILEKPKAVVVDYILGPKINGTEVVKLCDLNCIPAIIITGHDGDITGLSKDRIFKKSADDSFFRGVEDWLYNVTGAKP